MGTNSVQQRLTRCAPPFGAVLGLVARFKEDGFAPLRQIAFAYAQATSCSRDVICHCNEYLSMSFPRINDIVSFQFMMNIRIYLWILKKMNILGNIALNKMK
jgi:hypothetical protein